MKRVTLSADVMRAMSVAGKSIRLTLKHIYHSPQEAEKAIREKAQNKADLEHWAMVMSAEAFSFDDIPAPMRENTIISMAAAMLVWEYEQEEGVA